MLTQEKNILNNKVTKKKVEGVETRHYLPATIEWFNSIYTYNHNYIKSLVTSNSVVNKRIKNFFLLVLKGKKNIFENMSKRNILYSINRIFVSNVYLKHTNNRIIINLYTYNKEKIDLMRKWLFLYITWLNTENIVKFKKEDRKIVFVIMHVAFLRKQLSIFSKNISNTSFQLYYILKKRDFLKNYESNNQTFHPSTEGLTKYNKNINGATLKYEEFFEIFKDIIGWETFEEEFFLFRKEFTGKPELNNHLQNYVKKLYVFYIRKSLADILKTDILLIYYNQMLSLSNYKFNESFMWKKGLGLAYLFRKIYQKQTKITIVDLKYPHLNSDILSDAVSTKLNDRNKKVLPILKKGIALANSAVTVLKYIKSNNSFNMSEENIEKIGFKFLKNKKINGIRLQASGRLTQRLTALRSISKLIYTGGLKNMSSYYGISHVMLRGYLKSNIQYTNINSKTRNGCYGLKVWVSSY
uniref:ribosomal protein S3 n=1 Tax=Phyllosticta yuccae TaxID=1151444 RepID=UPI00279C2316|nr:ribosomal protein S3 [Phyllosticta yuccae]WGC90062.1 ribosomal protein S3 [Phyllosticta yuccae]